mgnify:CR=1 FL=1
MRKQTEIKEEKIKALKELFEAKFRIKLPLFYLEFLKERMKEQETKDRGILLFFRKGREGGFEWISYYRKRVVGLCNRTNCKICNLEERKKSRDSKSNKLKVRLKFRQSYNQN